MHGWTFRLSVATAAAISTATIATAVFAPTAPTVSPMVAVSIVPSVCNATAVIAPLDFVLEHRKSPVGVGYGLSSIILAADVFLAPAMLANEEDDERSKDSHGTKVDVEGRALHSLAKGSSLAAKLTVIDPAAKPPRFDGYRFQCKLEGVPLQP